MKTRNCKVLSAYELGGTGMMAYRGFVGGCAELAEDRLDHALWRVFTVVGEDHRGVLGAAELERVLDGCAGVGEACDSFGGSERFMFPVYALVTNRLYGPNFRS